MGWRLVGLIAGSGVLVLSACSLERAGLGSEAADGATPRDAEGMPDAERPDAGPPCERFGAPRVVAVLDRDDFAEGTRSSVEIEDSGHLVLRPSPYRLGALLFTGYADALLEADDPSLDDIGDETPTGQALLDSLSLSAGGDTGPAGLLLDGQSEITVQAVGEIRIEEGDWDLVVTPDDVAVVEVGSEPWRVQTPLLGAGTVSFRAPRTDWYPIRLAWTDFGGPASLVVELVEKDGGGSEVSREVVGASRLRVDLSAHPGREMIGWDDPAPDDTPDGARLDPSDSTRGFGAAGYPPGVGITSNRDYTVQWVGRHYLPRDGLRMRADADDRYRLWVDGVFLGEDTDDTHVLPLTAGWYDVVFVLEQGGGGEHARLRYEGGAFAPEHMRPRSRFGGRVFGAGWTGPTDVDGGNATTQSFDLAAPGDVPTAVELSAVVDTPEPEAVQLQVRTPWGGNPSFRVRERGRWTAGGAGWHVREVMRPPAGATWTAAGTFEMDLVNDGEQRAVWRTAGALAHYGGHDDPHPRRGTFESTPIDLGVEHELTRVLSIADLPFGASVRAELRAARTREGLDAADYREATADGTLATPLVGRWAQLRLTLFGPGYDTPRLADARLVGGPCEDCDAEEDECPPLRNLDGVVAMYGFDEGEGVRVRDISGRGQALDLSVADPANVRWSEGTLTVVDPTILASTAAAVKVHEACKAANAISIEAWFRPATLETVSPGPGRIVSMSGDANHRNFTLGQELDSLEVRLRTNTGDDNGAPYLTPDGPLIATTWTHAVATWSVGQPLRLYVDGEEVATQDRDGDLSTWDPEYVLSVANEQGADRHWLGDLAFVAVYDRALTADEVAEHFRAGRD